MEEQKIPEGYKQTDVGVIPEDWDCINLGELGDIVRGGSPRPAGDPKYFNGDYIPWLTVASLTNIPNSQMEVTSTISKLTELGSRQSRTLNVGTLIISNSGATLGVAKILNIKCCANDGVAAIINQRKGDKLFIAHYINTQTKRLHDDVATGNGQPNLNTDLIRLIPIPFPKESEQTAIANALSDVDALIAELEKLIAKKQAIKTATMQQLLTGRTRLPEFANHPDGTPKGYKQTELGEIPEDWEVKPLSELCDLKSGSGITSESIDDSSKYRCYGGNGLRGYTKTFTHEGEYVLIGRQGALCGNIQYVNGKFFASEHALVSTPKNTVSAYWLAVYLERMNLNQYSESSAQPGLSAEKLKILKLIVPTTEEQTSIANILSDMDEEIQSLQKRLAKTRQIKQGMMQELLTGKTRLV